MEVSSSGWLDLMVARNTSIALYCSVQHVRYALLMNLLVQQLVTHDMRIVSTYTYSVHMVCVCVYV